MKKVIRIKNNNVYIGSLKVDMKAIKNFAFIAGTAFVIISSASLIKKSADKVQEPKPAGEDPITDGTLTQESTSSKKTYEAEYVVQNCDTLSGIVASYQTDPNKMYGIIETPEKKHIHFFRIFYVLFSILIIVFLLYVLFMYVYNNSKITKISIYNIILNFSYFLCYEPFIFIGIDKNRISNTY